MSIKNEIYMVEKWNGVEWVPVFPSFVELRDAQIEAAFIQNKGGVTRIITFKRVEP